MTAINVTRHSTLEDLEDAGAEERADDDGMKGPGMTAEVHSPARARPGERQQHVIVRRQTLPRGGQAPID